jgi:hypothetical protein
LPENPLASSPSATNIIALSTKPKVPSFDWPFFDVPRVALSGVNETRKSTEPFKAMFTRRVESEHCINGGFLNATKWRSGAFGNHADRIFTTNEAAGAWTCAKQLN